MTFTKGEKARLIAFYLPQFHPIPENDKWWGKGFTEWTNVAKARPFFPGHYQPHLPADLGFYDLRVPETRIAQAELAQAYGIEGFCYWHYWFAGKRLLERPFNEVLKSGEPDFPFCLGWANQSWTGIWHDAPDRILIEQTYPGAKDYEAHFYSVLDAFGDSRYITIDNKPIFIVFRPQDLSEPKQFTDLWQRLALQNGLRGIYFIGISPSFDWNPIGHGFDAVTPNSLGLALEQFNNARNNKMMKVSWKLFKKSPTEIYENFQRLLRRPRIYSYRTIMENIVIPNTDRYDIYPTAITNWDNTPRSGINGLVLHNSTPEVFKEHLMKSLAQVYDRHGDRRVVFLKSWNEWAEGNYLEPDIKYGLGFLESIKQVLPNFGDANNEMK